MELVVRDVLQPRDEAGAPRRFRSHREALTRIASLLAGHGPKLSLNFVWLALLWLAWAFTRTLFFGEPLDLIPAQPGLIAVMLVTVPLALWVVGTALIYVYVTLSGGVMSRAERNRTRRTPRG